MTIAAAAAAATAKCMDISSEAEEKAQDYQDMNKIKE